MFNLEYRGRGKFHFVTFEILIFPTLEQLLPKKLFGSETSNVKVKFYSRVAFRNWHF